VIIDRVELAREDYELLRKVEEIVNSQDLIYLGSDFNYNSQIITLSRLRQRAKGTLAVIERDGSIDDRQRKRLESNLRLYVAFIREEKR